MPEIAHEEGIFRITKERNVAVAAWRDAPSVAQMRAFERVGLAMSRAHPAGTALFNVVLSGTPNFSNELRDETTRISARKDMFTLATAHLVLVEGFVGVAVRAFLTTSMLLGKTSTPTKVFGKKDLAVDWVHGLLDPTGKTWTKEQLLALVELA